MDGRKCLLLVFCILFIPGYMTADTDAWRSRVVYHILTDRFSHPSDPPTQQCDQLRGWCGGTFQGIINQLDYVQQLGADAIWISPMVLNTQGGYHGYWAKDIDQIEPHFGTEQDLKDLIQACHDRNMFIMLDVVPNHMGYPPGCDWNPCPEDKLLNVSGFEPFSEIDQYHSLCAIEDYTNQTQVEECRLANLPDLNQTVPWVRETLLNWVQDVRIEYGFDGYRIDTVRHIAMDFWPEYQSSAGVFTMGEVANEDAEYTAAYQQALTAVFNFPLFYTLKKIFNERTENFVDLKNNLILQRTHFADTTVLGTFVDNHDVPRFLNLTADQIQFKNALAYIIFAEGIPFIYYGSEQGFHGGGDPSNRESLWPHYDTESTMFKFIQNLLTFRQSNVQEITPSQQTDVHADDDSFCFTRGSSHELLVCISRIGQGMTMNITVDVLQEDGTEYTNILDPEDKVTVKNNQVIVGFTNGEPKVYEAFSFVPSSVCSRHNNDGRLSNLTLIIIWIWISKSERYN